jgi:type I restriction enzyme S subunit
MNTTTPNVRFGEFLKINLRPFTLASDQDANLVGVKWYGEGPFHREYKPALNITKKSHFVIKSGDVIYNKLFAWKGSFGIVPPELDGMFVSDKFPTYTLDRTKVNENYLKWYFRYSPLWDQARDMSTGSAALSKFTLNPPKFLELRIPLPSLVKQQRIVAELEQLMVNIDEARRQRVAAEQDSEKIVRTYSNYFFNPDSHYPKFSLGEVAEIRSGVTLGRELTGKTIHLPYLRVANVQDGHLNLQKMKIVEILESEKDKWKLLPGDLLLTEGGDWDKLGRGTVWRNEIPDCIHQNHIFRLRFNLEFLPEYVSLFIGSDFSKSYFQSASKQTTNLASINQKQLKNLKIPKPSLTEQRKIVARVDRLRVIVDEVKRLQAETEREMEALVPAVLAKAFS